MDKVFSIVVIILREPFHEKFNAPNSLEKQRLVMACASIESLMTMCRFQRFIYGPQFPF